MFCSLNIICDIYQRMCTEDTLSCITIDDT